MNINCLCCLPFHFTILATSMPLTESGTGSRSGGLLASLRESRLVVVGMAAYMANSAHFAWHLQALIPCMFSSGILDLNQSSG
jgi:hypothetical protein